MYTDIRYEVRDGVATITINRPEKLNCFRFETVTEMTAALRTADTDPSVGVVVLTGAGDKAFSVGGDISVLLQLDEAGAWRWHRNLNELGLLMRRLGKPIIAAVNGYCIGGGNELNLFCDLSIASDRARFGQAGPRVGSAPLWGGTQLLPRVVGERRAKEIIFLCRQYSAQEALEMGLVNRVVPHEELYAEVRRWADELLGMSPAALATVKRAIDYDTSLLAASLEYGSNLLTGLWTSPEGREGMRAFVEKRKPNFRDR